MNEAKTACESSSSIQASMNDLLGVVGDLEHVIEVHMGKLASVLLSGKPSEVHGKGSPQDRPRCALDQELQNCIMRLKKTTDFVREITQVMEL